MKLPELFQVRVTQASNATPPVSTIKSAQPPQTLQTRAPLKGISIQEPLATQKPVARSIPAEKEKAHMEETKHPSPQSSPGHQPKGTDTGAGTSAPSIAEKSVSPLTDLIHSSDPQTVHQEN